MFLNGVLILIAIMIAGLVIISGSPRQSAGMVKSQSVATIRQDWNPELSTTTEIQKKEDSKSRKLGVYGPVLIWRR